ncbi:MAG TPA: DUF4129 domain-containing protein [Tepidisphaeraceae bacterium]|nr:DUF4129 domain-containing protein [Tepidisphaeraceae bacterium]
MTLARTTLHLTLSVAAMSSCATLANAAEGTGRAAAPVPAATTDDPHQHLNQILQRPMFRAWRSRQEGPDFRVESPLSEDFDGSWIRKPFTWIGDLFEWLFRSRRNAPRLPNLPSGDGLSTALKAVAWAVLGVALLFLTILLYRVLRRPTATSPAARLLSRQQVRDAMESGDALALGTGQWLDEADRLASEQDFRAVYRALYLALLSGLHTVGKIEHTRNRTNWAYVERYRGPANERQTFGELTTLFDRVWYGRKPASGDDLDVLRHKVALLTQKAAGGGAA